ncbi:MAG: aminotransferase class III-fold pyridoxal phosphate-dependent enzyme, partial [Pseudomonadota bacterium]
MGLASRETDSWRRLDDAHYLHPFTDYKALQAEGGARVIVRAEGAYQWDSEGNKILDGLAGLGCVNLGYGRRELVEAASAAMSELSFCQSFFKTTNPAAIELARELVDLTPDGLNRVFFQSSGSEANETAARLALRYWSLCGRPEKRLIIARENAYHGSTMLSASLSGIPPMHFAGGELPFQTIHHIPAPYRYVHGRDMDPDAFGRLAASWLEDKIIELGAENVAVFFAEPLQGAGGAIIPPDTYWPEVQRICANHDVLLAVDEVVCGFGRTGEWFGS